MDRKWNLPAVNRSFDILTLAAGVLLALSPWLLGFAAAGMAAWNAWIVGAAIALLSIGALAAFSQWEDWGNLALGIWAAASPWVLGFADLAYAGDVHVALGLVVALIAAAKLWRDNGREPSRA